MTKDTGGPAFPRPVSGNPDHDGMTLRDWFAGQALSGMTGAGTEFMNALCKRAKERGISEEELGAKMAYVLADAMLAERSKP